MGRHRTQVGRPSRARWFASGLAFSPGRIDASGGTTGSCLLSRDDHGRRYAMCRLFSERPRSTDSGRRSWQRTRTDTSRISHRPRKSVGTIPASGSRPEQTGERERAAGWSASECPFSVEGSARRRRGLRGRRSVPPPASGPRIERPSDGRGRGGPATSIVGRALESNEARGLPRRRLPLGEAPREGPRASARSTPVTLRVWRSPRMHGVQDLCASPVFPPR